MEQGPDSPGQFPYSGEARRDGEVAGLAWRSVLSDASQVGLQRRQTLGHSRRGLPSGPWPGSPLEVGRPSGTHSSAKALVLV